MEKIYEEVKIRAKFSPEQLQTLESYFERYEFIDDNITRHLSEELAVTKRQIRNWFQNKRAAIRRRKFKESGASYPLIKKSSWSPFPFSRPNNTTSSQLTSIVDSGGNQQSPGSQTKVESLGGASSSRSLTGTSPSSSFYASPNTSPRSSYTSSPATSPSHSFRDGGASTSSSNASQDKSPSWSVESYTTSSSCSFLTQPVCYGTRVPSPCKGSTKSPTYQPSMTSWRLPLSELSLNNSFTESSPDVSPEEEYASSSFQMYVTPPVDQELPNTDIADIDWTLGVISAQNQMANADVWECLARSEDRSTEPIVGSEMAVAQPVSKTFFSLDTNSVNSAVFSVEPGVDDAQITSIISDLESDYLPDQSKVENIVKYLKDN